MPDRTHRRLQLVSPDEPDEPTRRTFASGRISGSRSSRSRYDERKRLEVERGAAHRAYRRAPWSKEAEARLIRAELALERFDLTRERVH